MSDRLEWADTTSGAQLLFPGEDINGATVDHGELAIAFWTGSNGIALSGPPQQLAERLEQVATIARTAVVLLAEPLRHLPDGLDPWLWITLGTAADSPQEHANTKCRTPGITVADPRRVTCGDCVAAWNAHWPDQFAIPVALRIPADPVDCRIGDQLPYASVTWISDEDDEEVDDVEVVDEEEDDGADGSGRN
ncbi:hypothetical protein ACFVYG_20145 [Streptomyces sp. NPDC058256]|uniref:hypothetical protein n=1 Tax=Streptomyces sp. NPDC058256 TaxID=3346408 RepID=UPI0036EACF78